LLVSHLNNDGAQRVYDEVFLLTVLSGCFLWYRYRNTHRDLNVRDGFLLVVLVWTVLPAFSALPFMIHLGMSHTDAYFEAMSALTATGATVMSGLDDLPMSINLWRHLMQWLGGMGLIVLVVAILPMLGIGGRQMLQAEVPGPMKDNRMTPRVTETAKGLWLIYVVMTMACILAYYWAGMSWFDAICHSFSTVSLGGFRPMTRAWAISIRRPSSGFASPSCCFPGSTTRPIFSR
jgi:trk system potassium uptake protein